MSRDNVKRVLVTSGNQAVAAVGTDLGALALGQVGVFDNATHLAIDATKKPANFYVAVGIDTVGGGTKTDHKESAGQAVQANRIVAYTFRPHTAGRPQIVTVGGIAAPVVGTDYAIKLEFRNAKISRNQGQNQFSQTYAAVAESTSAEDLVNAFVDTINNNSLSLVSAEATYITSGALTVAGDGTSKEYAAGAAITVEGDVTIARTKGTLVASIAVTTLPITPNKATNLNLNYYDLRETTVIVSLTEGFTTSATITETQELAYEEGDGAQIRQAEYHETGLADPYVLSEVTGTARALAYNAVGGVKYDRIVVEYGQDSIGGFQKFLSQLQTDIAIPAVDTVTRNGLVAILDAQVAAVGLPALAAEAAAASVDPAVVEADDYPVA